MITEKAKVTSDSFNKEVEAVTHSFGATEASMTSQMQTTQAKVSEDSVWAEKMITEKAIAFSVIIFSAHTLSSETFACVVCIWDVIDASVAPKLWVTASTSLLKESDVTFAFSVII